MPSSPATPVATAKSDCAADSCIGGRLIDPLTVTVAPGTVGESAANAASTRAFSAGSLMRVSTMMWAAAGTTFSVVPADATVGVTVVPTSGRANEAIACTWAASSTSELMPFSGSSPACDARPAMSTRNVPTPLRPTFSAPPSADGSMTST